MERIERLVFGWALIILGILSLPTPIPGLLIIIAGMAILGVEKEKNLFHIILNKIRKWKKK